MPDTKPLWKLSALKLRKIDRVARGDNPAARVLLAKAAGKPGFGHEYAAGGAGGTCKVCGKTHESGDMDRRRTRSGSMGKTAPEFPANSPTLSPSKANPTEDRMPDINLDALPDDVKAAFGDLQTQLTTATAALASAEGAGVAQELETVKAELETAKATIAGFQTEKADFEKAVGARPAIKREDLPDDVRKALDAADADRAEATALKERVAKMERDSNRSALIAKAATDYPSLPAKADEVADLFLEAAEKMAPETVAKLESLLKAANAQIDSSALFREVGRAAGNPDARAALDAEVDKVRKDNPTMGRGDALAAVAKAHPELVNAVNG